ncbi:hypothetical protein [Paenibacillus chibensis]|uniref:hypothetical protein n=1 Tax=Paenibacillus chibensis TaxID=59846 RepID=UPI0013E2B2BE|nr:hypothetical protein [Paenibacillus chibensis]MEC0369356.1 hypothetical protein [Paenibacillus chibensis]
MKEARLPALRLHSVDPAYSSKDKNHDRTRSRFFVLSGGEKQRRNGGNGGNR